MAAERHDPCARGLDGYPPYVRGWFRKARAGTMQRGYRDVGYLLASRLGGFQPAWLNAAEWRYHLDTLWRSLAARDERAAMQWFSATYPGLVAMLPARQRREFVAGLGEPGRPPHGMMLE
jgi:hypothetical protein